MIDEKLIRLKKLLGNAKKALKEHALLQPHSACYASLRAVSLPRKKRILSFSVNAAEEQGRRYSMEDALFIVDKKQSLCLGVLDGHAGSEVAGYAAKRFQEIFSSQDPPFDVEQALRDAFLLIQDEIEYLHPEWSHIGSTAIVVWIDKEENLIYTATLGDSFAGIYRVVRKTWKTIPLSCIRNWSSKRDRASAKKALGAEIPWRKSHKEMRHPPPGLSVWSGCGLNVSRALGDVAYKGMIHDPKIAVAAILPRDIIILACDGLKDFTTEEEIIEQIGLCESFEKLSKQLADYAIRVKNSSDNVSVIALLVQ